MDLLAQYDSDVSDDEHSADAGGNSHDKVHVAAPAVTPSADACGIGKHAATSKSVSSDGSAAVHLSSALPEGFFSVPAMHHTEPEDVSIPSPNPTLTRSQNHSTWSVSAPNLAPKTSAEDDTRNKLLKSSPPSNTIPDVTIVGPSRPKHTTAAQDGDEDLLNPTSGLFAALPAPKTAVKKVIKLKLPIQKALLKVIEDEISTGNPEEQRPAKRTKTNNNTSLVDLLPAPKNATNRSDLFSNLAAPAKQKKAAAASVGPSPQPYAERADHAVLSNEMYRVDEAPLPPAVHPAPQPTGHAIVQTYEDQTYQPYAAQSYEAQPYEAQPYTASASEWDSSAGDPKAYTHADTYGYSGADTWHTEASAPGVDDLQRALEAEKERAARKGQALNVDDIQFVEINQAQLKHVDPAAKEAHDALRNALGSEYALGVRAKAATFTGSKMARRKHQIGTLFHTAKMRELELMENRAQAMKNKAETQGKYGW